MQHAMCFFGWQWHDGGALFIHFGFLHSTRISFAESKDGKRRFGARKVKHLSCARAETLQQVNSVIYSNEAEKKVRYHTATNAENSLRFQFEIKIQIQRRIFQNTIFKSNTKKTSTHSEPDQITIEML